MKNVSVLAVAIIALTSNVALAQTRPQSSPRTVDVRLTKSEVNIISPQIPARSSKTAGSRLGSSTLTALTFAPAVLYGLGYRPSSFAVADLNGDGKLDLVATILCVDSLNCAYNGEATALLGNGDGTFRPGTVYDSGGYFASSVAVADVNGDGKPDLLVTNQCASIDINDNCVGTGTVGVLFGNGDGTFQTAADYVAGSVRPFSLAVADVNNDGKPDLVAAGSGGIAVLLGNGDGTFGQSVTYDTGDQYAYSVVVADVNGDGKPDLVLPDCVLFGNGDGTFQGPVVWGLGWASVVVADVNGDGKPDIVLSRTSSSSVGLLLGNGDGTFQPLVTYPSGASGGGSATVADVNGDGRLDIVVANSCTDSGCNNQEGAIGLLLGNGDGTFQPATVYDSGDQFALSVAVADVNEDGKPDLLVLNSGTDLTAQTFGDIGVLINTSLTPTTTALTSLQNPSNFAQAVTFTATVTAQPGYYKGTPTGTVTFAYGTAPLCSAVALNSGTATCVYSGLSVGSDTITASYSGDANFNPSSGSVTQNVNKATTTTTVISSLNPSSFNQQVTFTAAVAGQFGGTPTGTVTFNDGSTTLGTSPLSGGMATFSTSALASGLHSINAVYSADSNFSGSSSSLNQTVNQASTTLMLTSSVNPSGLGQAVTFTAAITPQYGGHASGTVTFKNGTATLRSSAVNGNVASLTTSSLPVGTHSITAIYGGDSNFTGSASPVLSQVVKGPAVKLSLASLTFPTQVVFTTSKAKTVTLTNTGLGVMSIKNIAVSGPFAQTNTCGTTVASGASCPFTVTFKPTTIGTLTGSVSITDNAPASPQKIALTGIGTYVQLSPTSLNFGNQPTGTTSLAKTITMSNKGGVAVSITGISIAGADLSDFSQTNTCGTSVAAGASCFIKVKFTPAATGARTATVSISDDGGGSPQKVSLTGTGT